MRRALVVDDVPENRHLLRALLEGHGFAVDEAANGASALSEARSEPPELVIADLLMPVMDGYALLREWKADTRLKSIPFVVYTATYTEPKDTQLALDLGADAFIVKPAEPDSFMTKVEEVLTRAEHGALSPAQTASGEDFSLLTRHNDALVRKLAQKAEELKAANQALRQDVARRKRAEMHANQLLKELRGKSSQLEQALTMARMGVWLWELKSDAFTALEGRGPISGLPEVDYPTTGRAFRALLHEDDRSAVEAKIEAAKRGDEYDAEFRVVLASGEERWVAMRGRCLRDATGQPSALTGLDQDVTDRKALEERLRHAHKMEAIGQLAGGIAHDFNNVLTAIIGNAELSLMQLSAGEPVDDSVREILRAGMRGKDLTRRILTFSRPQAQRLVPTNLQHVMLEAERLLRATLPAGIDLSFRVAEEAPLVYADSSQIHQVVLNLITNARDAIGPGKGQIEARLECFQVDRALCVAHPELHPGRYVRLSVQDSGVGMDDGTLEHMFEPFYTTKGSGSGVGLGLSVVHGIVRGHGGAIFAESKPGRGTTFNVLLPACVEGTCVAQPQRAFDGEIQGHGERLLYVDDEASLVYLAVRLLERSGYRVDGFTRVDDALDAFRAAPASYDAVITDYNMPGMSGVELAQQMLRIRSDAPIALTTGYLRPEELERAQALGIRELISKPYALEELGPLLQRMLSGPEAQIART